MFKQYITAELIIFTRLKKYFEKLPPVGSDEYYNAFYDIVAQYINGGNEYLVAGDLFNFAIVSQAQIAYEQLSKYYQKHINEYYEIYMNHKMYDDDTDEIVYDLDEIYHHLMGRFKAWIDDTFDEEYLEDGYIDEEKYIEEDYEVDDVDEHEQKEKEKETKSSNIAIDPNIDIKALRSCQKYNVSYNNYQKFLERKSAKFFEFRFNLTIIDLLYISSFGMGNASIHVNENDINEKLNDYIGILNDIYSKFGTKSLDYFPKTKREQLIKLLYKACELTNTNKKTKIEGLDPSYLSTLLNAHFPGLIPILNRRVLINLGLITKADLYENGQIKNIESFYGPLVEKIVRLSKKEDRSVSLLGYDYYIKKLDINSLEN